MRDGEGHGVMEAAMDLIRHTDVATRMSAAAVLYNISRLLPKDETVQVLQLGSGLAHHLQEKTDGETGGPTSAPAPAHSCFSKENVDSILKEPVGTI